MQLCQGYPGYVVNMLKELLYLDGNEISDEARSNDCSWQQDNGTALYCKCILIRILFTDILTTSLITITTSYSIKTSDMTSAVCEFCMLISQMPLLLL